MDKEKQQCVAAIMGLVVGDALGVPVEFVSRKMLKNNPVVFLPLDYSIVSANQ